MEKAGARAVTYPFEPEVVGRSPRLVVGRWSDVGAVAQKLTECGLTASAEALESILVECQREAVARHRPLGDDEVITVVRRGGAVAGGE